MSDPQDKVKRGRESDLLRRAQTTREQLRAEFAGVQAESALPVVENGRRVTSAEVISPSHQELRVFQDQSTRVCGNCKHFDLESGRKKMIDEQFFERLTHEQEWKLRHLGAKPDELGLCGNSGGTMVVSFMAKGCDAFREKH